MTALRDGHGAYPETYAALFKAFASEIDQENAKRERLVKASRDITQASKKLIFALHRIPAPSNHVQHHHIHQHLHHHNNNMNSPLQPQQRRQAFAAVHADLETIRRSIATHIAAEIPANTDGYVKMLRAFSPGMQEYVEAASLLVYLETGRLVTLDELNHDLSAACLAANVPCDMHVDPGDYVLGVADLTGELMRVAVAAAANGDVERPFQVRGFLQKLLPCFQDLVVASGSAVSTRDLAGKVRVFGESLAKVERTCFDMMTRREECIYRGGHRAIVGAAAGSAEEGRREEINKDADAARCEGFTDVDQNRSAGDRLRMEDEEMATEENLASSHDAVAVFHERDMSDVIPPPAKRPRL